MEFRDWDESVWDAKAMAGDCIKDRTAGRLTLSVK